MKRWRQDPEGVRTAILKAARERFAEKGVAGTSLQQIATAAGVTKSLINHHFGSKAKLFDAVRGDMFRDYFEAQRHLILSKRSDLDVIAESLRTYFAFLKKNQDVVRMAAWMGLEQAASFEDHSEGLTEFGVQRIQKAQEEGLIRDDVHGFYILASMWTLIEHWFLARRDYLARYYTEIDLDRADAEYLESIVNIMLDGIRPK